MTLGLMRALAESQVPCPERVSVLSFDDFEWAANFSPKLTTIAQPTHEMVVSQFEIRAAASQPTVSVLGPSIDSKLTCILPQLDDITLKAVDDRKKKVYIYGVVKYEDTFGDRHETGFCVDFWYGAKSFLYCGNNNYAN